jgi:hypothetical protein
MEKHECGLVKAATCLEDLPNLLQKWLDNADPQTDEAHIAWYCVEGLQASADKLRKEYASILMEITNVFGCDKDCSRCKSR